MVRSSRNFNNQGGSPTPPPEPLWKRVIAIGTFLLVIVGACVQLYSARIAYKSSEISLKAAQISEDSERKALRAYVTVNELLVRETKDKNGVVIRAQYAPSIENTGGTAVRKGRVWFGTHCVIGPSWEAPVEPPPSAMGADFFPQLGSDKSTHIALGPRSKVTFQAISAGADLGTLELMRNAEEVVYIYGRFEYFDAIEQTTPHVTKFCFMVGHKDKQVPREEIPINFCVGPSNCIDDECLKDNSPPLPSQADIASKFKGCSK